MEHNNWKIVSTTHKGRELDTVWTSVCTKKDKTIYLSHIDQKWFSFGYEEDEWEEAVKEVLDHLEK